MNDHFKDNFKDWLSSYWILIICLMAFAVILLLITVERSLIFLLAVGMIILVITILYPEKLLLLAIRAKRIERSEAPMLYNKLEKISSGMGIPCPQVLVKPGNYIDVFSVYTGKNKKVMVFTSKALDTIIEQDMDTILERELTKTKAQHGSLKKFSNNILSGITRLRDKAIDSFINRKNVSEQGSEVVKGYHIRAATENDIISMFRLQYSAFREHAFSLHETRMAIGNTSVTQVIDKDGKLIGYYVGRVRLGRSGLYGRGDIVVIDESHRSQGLGRYLVLNHLKAFTAARCRYMLIEVMTDNYKALKLYDDIGFKRIGILKDFYSEGSHAILMKK